MQLIMQDGVLEGLFLGKEEKCFTDHALLKYIRIWSFGWGPKIFLYIYIYIYEKKSNT